MKNGLSYILLMLVIAVSACKEPVEQKSHAYMLELLEQTAQKSAHPDNIFANKARIKHFSQMDSASMTQRQRYDYALDLLRNADYLPAAGLWQELKRLRQQGQLSVDLNPYEMAAIDHYLALSYLRLGELENCIANHSAVSCLFPVQQAGYHQLPLGSEKAIEAYTEILRMNPDDLSAQWLLNIAYMTLGKHPDQVPESWLIPDSCFQSDHMAKELHNIAGHIGFDIRGLSGGLIVDDFTNDGYLDIMVSEWGQTGQLRFFVSNADGSFSEKTMEANLTGLFGGLNLLQADYNNDGWLDVFVLRGGWLGEFGDHPNSLLKNNGDGTFSDVTQAAGILSFHPTQTATWNDFNRDGWLDIFIGNETTGASSFHYSELYINQGDGTFKEVAGTAGLQINKRSFRISPHYIKGVTSADYNNDNWPDIYVSTGSFNRDRNFLFRNNGVDAAGNLTFSDVTEEAGLAGKLSTFSTWFWDYNNDGHPDIFASSYLRSHGFGSITEDLAAEYLGKPHEAETGFLFKNNGNGTFSNVSADTRLDKILYAMGANFGDFDNDGWLDFYLGTGNIGMDAIMPNRMFRNAGGVFFQDVTTAAGVGHLQKGHGVSFSDIDNDGDQDLLMSMGGAFEGDVFQNAFFQNPYEHDNHWITLILQGTTSNRSAIGARLTLTIEENGRERKLYRDINSGGSFGASPLRAEIGLGRAEAVKELIITWPCSAEQRFNNLESKQFYKIVEGQATAEKVERRRLHFSPPSKPSHTHAPI